MLETLNAGRARVLGEIWNSFHGRDRGRLRRPFPGPWQAPGCGKAGERAGSTCTIDVDISAAHHQGWAAYAMSLGFRV